MDTVFDLKGVQEDGFEVQYEIIPMEEPYRDERRRIIYENISELDNKLDILHKSLDEVNEEIDNFTNHADGLDYAVAVTAGIITGLVDSFFVGKWDFKEAKAKANNDVNNKVINFAKKDPRYEPWCKKTDHGKKELDPNRLDSAIKFLEKHYRLPGDGEYKLFKDDRITDASHHLDDFCHHPTFIGMICCVIVQFTGSATYRSSSDAVKKAPVEVNQYGKLVSENTWGKVFAGIINWFFNAAKTLANRKGHIMSDIAGSSTSVGKGNEGAGVPGSILSMLKELSALPCFKDTNFAENLRKAYQNGIGSGGNKLDLGAFNVLFDGASSKMDKRTEMAVFDQLKKQSIPIILNEILVRGFYFIRRFIEQMKEKKSISEIEWKKVLPIKNRTVVRMMTIASGTFVAFDVADAAIRSGGLNANCLLRVNFVGIGRFAIAIGTDVGMGIKKGRKEKERNELLAQIIDTTKIKLYYKKADMLCSMSDMYAKEAEMYKAESDMWIAVKETQQSIDELYEQIGNVVNYYQEVTADMDERFDDIASMIPDIEEKNPGLIEEMLRRLSDE